MRDWRNVRENHLQSALEDLHFAARPDERPGLNGIAEFFGHIPQAGIHHPCTIAQVDREIKRRIAVRTELPLGDEENLIDEVIVFQLTNPPPDHAVPSLPLTCCSAPKCRGARAQREGSRRAKYRWRDVYTEVIDTELEVASARDGLA